MKCSNCTGTVVDDGRIVWLLVFKGTSWLIFVGPGK